jgi:hypothetical protein
MAEIYSTGTTNIHVMEKLIFYGLCGGARIKIIL